MQQDQVSLFIYKGKKFVGLMTLESGGFDRVVFAADLSDDVYNQFVSIQQTLPTEEMEQRELLIKKAFLVGGFTVLNAEDEKL